MSFKKLLAATAISISVLCPVPSHAAGSCGIGTVTEVREGAKDADNVFVRLQFDSEQNQPGTVLVNTTPGTSIWIRYKSTSVGTERLNAIRSLAYLALVTGKPVYTWTHNDNNCLDATEISVFNQGVDPRGSLPSDAPDPLVN